MLDWVIAHREALAVVALMAVAAALRYWNLDDMALHHDESLHAQFTYYLFDGKGYQHDPLMHGPFLFHTGALVFFLFGDNDTTIRILPALFGTILVGMPYLLRRQIGMKAVIIASVLLLISPTLLYYSRFDRNEAWVAVWTLGMVICVWRYLDELRPRYLYILAALMALSFASKEVTYINVAILLSFVDLMLAVELGKRREDEAVSNVRVWLRTAALVPVAWLIAAGWPLLGRHPFGRDTLPPIGDVLVVLGTLALPQFAAAIQVLPFVGNDGYRAPSEASLTVITVGILLLACAYVGIVLWRPRDWLIAAACFFVPYVLLYTTFFTNQPLPLHFAIHLSPFDIDLGPNQAFWDAKGGFWSGIWGSLDYWLDQHHVRRGDQPIYYYALMTPLYEFLPLILALVGFTGMALRGNSLHRYLLFWTAAAFVGYSVAGEKMPWLEVHIALPLAMVAAMTLSAAIDRLDFSGSRSWSTAASMACLTAGAVLLIVEANASLLRFVGLAMLAGTLGWVLGCLASSGPRAFGRAGLTVLVAVLFALTVRASLTAAFHNNDTPVEMMVYTQTSEDVKHLRNRIDALADESGLGYNLPIVIDGLDGYAWPWAWYLRHYHEVSYAVVNANYVPPPGAVLLINRSDASYIDAAGYSETPYKHRWWFNETYRSLLPALPVGETRGRIEGARELLSNVAGELTSWSSLKSLGDFFLFRRDPATGTGAAEGVAYFPESLAAFDVDRSPAKPSPEPSTLPDGRIVFGRRGNGPGELQQPGGLFVDAQGTLWVADGRNNRVQQFDATGRHLAVFGRGGGNDGFFNEPWGVAVDAEGSIYVADTWNHRIQKFSPQFSFLASWGRPSTSQSPGLLDLFGPRSIAIAPDGTLWVTDTGNKRLVHFSPTGEPLGAYGLQGAASERLDEPVGLTFDRTGRLYIADTWNARIQRLDPTLTSASSFTMTWTSREVFAKPYLTVLNDGRILATDPGKGLLVLLNREGQPLGLWRPETDSQPVGVAALPDGGFAFSDSRRNEIQVVPERLISELFR